MIDNNAEMSARLKALEEKKKALELELARLKEERDLAIRNSPVDLKEHFEKIDTGEFKTKHEALRWFCKCIFAANCLYASVPVSVFQKLYERKKGMKIDTDKIHHFMNQMPEENEAMILVGDRLIAAKLYDSGQYKLVEHDQGDKEFYIPEPGEVELLYNYKYPAYEKEYQK